MDVVQIVGDPDMKAQKVSVLVGGGSLGLGREEAPMIQMLQENVDVVKVLHAPLFASLMAQDQHTFVHPQHRRIPHIRGERFWAHFGGLYEIPETTLRELAAFFKEHAQMDVVQIVGDPDMKAKNFVGAVKPGRFMGDQEIDPLRGRLPDHIHGGHKGTADLLHFHVRLPGDQDITGLPVRYGCAGLHHMHMGQEDQIYTGFEEAFGWQKYRVAVEDVKKYNEADAGIAASRTYAERVHSVMSPQMTTSTFSCSIWIIGASSLPRPRLPTGGLPAVFLDAGEPFAYL